jgi:hypothetical protein
MRALRLSCWNFQAVLLSVEKRAFFNQCAQSGRVLANDLGLRRALRAASPADFAHASGRTVHTIPYLLLVGATGRNNGSDTRGAGRGPRTQDKTLPIHRQEVPEPS